MGDDDVATRAIAKLESPNTLGHRTASKSRLGLCAIYRDWGQRSLGTAG